jgi:GNAT superfamily N-acetyltransferase
MGASVRLTGDLAAVRRLDVAIFPDGPDLVTDGAAWWLATVDDVPVGYAGLALHDGWPGVGFLRRAGVLPRHRGRGLHDRMIAARLRWAKRRGLAAVVTYTMPHNAESANNLMDHGFRLADPPVAYVGGGVLYWRRECR